MISDERTGRITRRDLLRRGGILAGGMVVVPLMPAPSWAGPFGFFQAQAQTPTDAVAAYRAQMGAIPVETTKLTDSLAMLSGPGGNVLVINGPDGKVVVDSFVLPAFPNLRKALDGIGPAPVKVLIDTHWHLDHADNNENFRKAGAAVVAHENTRKRLTETHDLLGMHFPPAPAGALPTETFKDRKSIEANGEKIEIAYIPPAHTDTDVSIHCTKGNVLHLGDVFFNGVYPFIDASTGGQHQRHDCRRRCGGEAHRRVNEDHSRARPARRPGGADEVSRHAGHRPRSRAETEGRGPNGRRSGCGEPDRRSRRHVGKGLHAGEGLCGDCVRDGEVTRVVTIPLSAIRQRRLSIQ